MAGWREGAELVVYRESFSLGRRSSEVLVMFA